jgi:hypothetical protein
MIWWLMNMEQLAEWDLSGETKVVGENLPYCHFVHVVSYSGITEKKAKKKKSVKIR